MTRSIYVNVSIKDLAKSIEFYKRIGFEQKLEYTNEDAGCMAISDTIYLMLLTEDFFKTFTNKAIANTLTTTETILSISAETKAEADELADRAIAMTGKPPKEAESELDSMYVRNFQDVDGHMWEVVYTDPSFGK